MLGYKNYEMTRELNWTEQDLWEILLVTRILCAGYRLTGSVCRQDEHPELPEAACFI